MTYEKLAKLLQEAADRHHEYEERYGLKDKSWPMWYSVYLLTKYGSEFDSEPHSTGDEVESILGNVGSL